MNKNTVKNKIKSCVDKLYVEDKYLFDSKVCERCLMFRLAYYFQSGFPNYYVDCEFNKMAFKERGQISKVEPTEQGGKLKKMYADIIIHKRDSETKNNFICVEIKNVKRGRDRDLERLKNMIRESGFWYKDAHYTYAYDFGIFVYIPGERTKSEIRIFENGAETQN